MNILANREIKNSTALKTIMSNGTTANTTKMFSSIISPKKAYKISIAGIKLSKHSVIIHAIVIVMFFLATY